MANPNEHGTPSGASVPPTEVIPPSERRADKGMRKTGFWAIVIGGLLLGITAIAFEVANSGKNDDGARNPGEHDAGTPAPR